MSMTMLTILQFTGVLFAYGLVVFLLPAIVFRPILKGRKLAEQFLICLLVGNFFVMYLVYALQLLHISGKFTILSILLVTVLVAGIKLNKINFGQMAGSFTRQLRRISRREIGKKTLVYHGLCHLRNGLIALWNGFCNLFVNRTGQWLWLGLIICGLMIIYGSQMLNHYGYTASDIPVHLYWINAMKENDIFVAGVYPFGFHCMVYFINEIFEIDIYVVMRVMAFFQNILIHLVLLAFLKLCCRSKYIPYAMVFLFITGEFFSPNTYSRYQAPLPQEYGMIFILPAIYFGFRFFETKKNELKKESMLCLVAFAMSFAMTLTVHFYGTMIAGLFCLAMAIGYIALFVRKQYFVNIIVTCVISVIVALLPLGIAFATGTQLEGSLRWGMSVMSGGGDSEADEEESEEESEEDTEKDTKETETVAEEPIQVRYSAVFATASNGSKGATYNKVEQTINTVGHNIGLYVFNAGYYDCYKVVFGAIVMAIVLGIVFLIQKRYCYGAMILTTGIYMAIMSLLIAAKWIGLPSLMDSGRCSIYFAYSLPVLFGFCMDGILSLVFWTETKMLYRNAISLLISAALCILLVHKDMVRESLDTPALESNEAVACLTNIIREEKDFTWTICSANDETQMGKEHGYHYELIDFLRGMEHVGNKGLISIPTDTIYFFIEKRPLDYTVPYENSGQLISEAGAMNSLPRENGLVNYQGEKRWILMSRMYYWAQEYQRMYPNEMTIYCETDDFICYKVEQNPYRLYNYAIDYGYNTR